MDRADTKPDKTPRPWPRWLAFLVIWVIYMTVIILFNLALRRPWLSEQDVLISTTSTFGFVYLLPAVLRRIGARKDQK